LERLRGATRARHEALDQSVDVSTVDAYRRFLTASYAAVAGIETQLATSTERTDALRADLAELSASTPDALTMTLADSPSARLGATYVVEGSALGGMVLAERVSGFTTATRFLRLRGKETAARWRAFLATLDGVRDEEACITAACATFDHYARAFRMHQVVA
jgi:heme oxygenase